MRADDRRAIEFTRGLLAQWIENDCLRRTRDVVDAKTAMDDLDEVLAPKRAARTKRPPAKRATPRRSERVRDAGYLARVRELPCVCAAAMTGIAGAWGPCAGPIEAHHAGAHPAGRKCRAVPMCKWHHHDWTGHSGPFYDETKATRRAWSDAWIARTQETLRPRGAEEATR